MRDRNQEGKKPENIKNIWNFDLFYFANQLFCLPVSSTQCFLYKDLDYKVHFLEECWICEAVINEETSNIV